MLLFKISPGVALLGMALFYLGARRRKQTDVFDNSIVSPFAYIFFGGAMTIVGVVIVILGYLRGLI